MDTLLYMSTLQDRSSLTYYSPTQVALKPVELSCFEGPAHFYACQNYIRYAQK